MKGTRIIFSTLAILLATAPGAFAATTTKVFSSSILVLVFVGFLALIVLIQLIPAIMALIGALKGLKRKEENTRMAKVETND